MPELPEVAGLGSFLQRELLGAELEKAQITSFAVLKTASPPYTELQGRRLAGVGRYGKFIDLDFSDPADGGLHLVFHLAKAGWVRYS
ncbi:MAG: Fpg/Nei family DNA glycosylase, partial [Actinomycetota bacterium]|nr:Fpg/Nei family DNA glycosylase [Actinomycetota bacterium]